ncbi:MHYT domain-containing protein, partial [Salinisphaera sp.]|uniref:MHYT domain-containing protein n=1 Tax=Salinisphaera sp. TaxID=1914330 RepID=UPI000C5DF63A
MAGAYDQRLVALSVVVAILASYTALDVVGRMGERRDWRCYGWLAGGALALGAGVWAMHFVGMIAFRLPLDMGYDVDITSASWLMAVVACAFALNAVTHARLTRARLVVGASAMAAGIGGMHYTGMFAMRLHPGIEYTPILVGVSLLIAFAAS